MFALNSNIKKIVLCKNVENAKNGTRETNVGVENDDQSSQMAPILIIRNNFKEIRYILDIFLEQA